MMNEEEKLVKKIIGGDKQAFRRFYNLQERQLERLVKCKIGNRKDAEEVTQDIWLSFLDSLPLFRFGSSLKTFLWSIARHEIADYYRKKYAKRVIKLVPLVDKVYQENLYPAKLVSEEMGELIEIVYEQIKPAYVRLLRMKYEQEMSVRQIAKKLGESFKTVESKLFRARKVFQVVYEELMEE